MGFYTDKSDKTFFPGCLCAGGWCFRAAVRAVAAGGVENY